MPNNTISTRSFVKSIHSSVEVKYLLALKGYSRGKLIQKFNFQRLLHIVLQRLQNGIGLSEC